MTPTPEDKCIHCHKTYEEHLAFAPDRPRARCMCLMWRENFQVRGTVKVEPTPEKISWRELTPIKDKIQQIFKFLEIADVSQWRGMNVFEAGDADSLYGILETAFEQVESQARREEQELVLEQAKQYLISADYECLLKDLKNTPQ